MFMVLFVLSAFCHLF